MAMGFGASGMAAGIGQGVNNVTSMLNNYTMQKMQNDNAQEMQQNNPYVRLAAMKQMGGGGGMGGGTGVTGSAADIVSQRMNPETYGKPGHPGGASDPDGNFNPATMPLYGEEHKGMNIVAGGREQFQNQVTPVANAYIKTKTLYDTSAQNLQQLQQVVTQNRAKMQSEIAKVTGSMAPESPEYTEAIVGIREKYMKDEQRLKEMKQEMGGLEQSLQEYGGQLAQALPGLDIGGKGVTAQEAPTMEHLQGGARPPQTMAAPKDIGRRIFPQGQVPASMSASGYNPVMPHATR